MKTISAFPDEKRSPGIPAQPPHRIYVCAADNGNLALVLAFRDFLRGSLVRGSEAITRPAIPY
ncbi:hypothetical protein GCM10009565_75810 [Amycolatopsis albidoflavus]